MQVSMFAAKFKQETTPAVTPSGLENVEPITSVGSGPIENAPTTTLGTGSGGGGGGGGITALLSGAMENKYVLVCSPVYHCTRLCSHPLP